ncbi:response regulator transcription factor [Niameybacter massiliensis]|uniref:response regulator transcription factor n=1 Tax=Niameybacter massiliensis TaxID=1658108 RepID=UPI0006B54CCF|nr:response regulator [Niameybacter massiliensis]
MLKIIIVEDEWIIRKGLISTIDWLEMGCSIVGEASDGQEGLELIEEYLPDVVITDIRMPVMDGIEMIRKGKKIHDFESILLTSYEEFEYAKQAIKLQVFDYLLKPVDEENLKSALTRLRQKIEEKGQIQDIKQLAKEQERLYNPAILLEQAKGTQPQVEKVLEMIAQEYTGHLSIELIADEMGISSSYLSRKFKQVTGHTFGEILNGYRIQKATELLLSHEYKIYEVAEKVGFSEYKSFCTVFKKWVGLSPKEFMNQKYKST